MSVIMEFDRAVVTATKAGTLRGAGERLLISGGQELEHLGSLIRAGQGADELTRTTSEIFHGHSALLRSGVDPVVMDSLSALRDALRGVGLDISVSGTSFSATSTAVAADLAEVLARSSATDVADAARIAGRRAQVAGLTSVRQHDLSLARGIESDAARTTYHPARQRWGFTSSVSPYGDYIGEGRGVFMGTDSPAVMQRRADALRISAADTARQITSLGGDAPSESLTIARIMSALGDTVR